MAFDKLKSETPEEEFSRLAESFIHEYIPENSSGLKPIVSDITDTCAVLLEQVKDFVKCHNVLKMDNPSEDAVCDASYSLHKVAYMLYTCIDELNNNIDTSWYHEDSCGKNGPTTVIE